MTQDIGMRELAGDGCPFGHLLKLLHPTWEYPVSYSADFNAASESFMLLYFE